MNIIQTTRLTLAAGLLALTAVSAQAATIKLSYNDYLSGYAPSGTITRPGTGRVLAGEFDFSTSDNSTGIIAWDESLSAFCVEVDVDLQSSATYTVSEGLGSFGVYQGEMINRLFSNFYQTELNSSHSAAFQLALWEITHEAPDFGMDLTGGLFTASEFNGARTIANNWLADLSDLQSSNKYTFHTLTNSDSQNLLTVTYASVPEPGTLFLMGAGLFALFRARRKVR